MASLTDEKRWKLYNDARRLMQDIIESRMSELIGSKPDQMSRAG